MPGDDGVSSLRESMKQDYRHIGTLARNTASFILGRLLVRIKMLLTFCIANHLFIVSSGLDTWTSPLLRETFATPVMLIWVTSLGCLLGHQPVYLLLSFPSTRQPTGNYLARGDRHPNACLGREIQLLGLSRRPSAQACPCPACVAKGSTILLSRLSNRMFANPQ